MKKFLSLMLTLALIITTLALPITASAADISLQAAVEGNSINVTYTASAETVHPGDNFTIEVKATPSTDITVSSYVVDINYDGTQFTLNNAETDGLKKFDSDTTTAYVRLIKDSSIELTAETGLSLITLDFTVKESAVASSYTTYILGDDTAFTVKNGNKTDWYVLDSNLTDSRATIIVEANSYEVKIDGSTIADGKTYYSESGVNVSVTGTNIEYVKIGEEQLTAGDGGVYSKEVTTAGAYTVAVKVKGKTEETKTFTLNTDKIDAKLNTSITEAKTGYKRGDTFEVPVVISGLGSSAQAAMVSFKVTADTGLTLDTDALTTAGLTYQDGTVLYGDKDGVTGLSNNDKVATLKFTVAADAEYGVKSVVISEPKLALVKNAIDPTADAIGVETGTQKVVVVPSTAFGTLPENITTEAWTNSSYSVTVTTVDSKVGVRYLAVSDLTSVDTDTQTGLKAIYDNIDVVVNPIVEIKSEDKYVIVARVGDDTNAVYELVGTLTPGENAWYDATNPTVDVTKMDALSGVQDAKGGYSLDVSKLEKEDKLSGIAKLEYSLNGAEYTEFTGDTIALAAQNFNGNVTFKVTDKAGNSATSGAFALKLDMDDPTVTGMSVGEVKADATKDITARVADTGSGVTGEAVTVKAYKGSTEGDALTDVSAIEALGGAVDVTLNEETATYNANVAGRYYFVAQDAAGHKVFAYADVSFESISVASGIKVKVYEAASDYVSGFMTTADEALNDFSGTNGSFTYVNVKVDAPVENYINTVTLKKDDGEADEYTSGTAITEPGAYELTVITKHNVNESDYATATYKFTIVDETDMPSPNNDKRFNIIDYAMVKQLVELNVTLPTADNAFDGGIFSGDVTGDLKIDSADYADIIRSIRAGEKPGSYTFNVLNKTVSAGE